MLDKTELYVDTVRETYVLLHVDTRPWKWIRLSVATGLNLPMAAYAAATETTYEPGAHSEPMWVHLADYLSELSAGTRDVLSRDQWLALISGSVDGDDGVVAGVFDPDYPAPAHQFLRTEFGTCEYSIPANRSRDFEPSATPDFKFLSSLPGAQYAGARIG